MSDSTLHVRHLVARTLSLLIGLVFAAGPALAESNRIVVLSGQDLKPYQEVITGFQQSLNKQGIGLSVEIHAVQGNPAMLQERIAEVKRNGARLVVTLGGAATQATVREAGHLPILASMIVSAEDIRPAANATAVLLDFSLETQLHWLHRLVPGATTVGLLFSPKDNQAKVNAAGPIAKGVGLTLVPQAVETARALPDALDTLSRTVDVMWGIADSVVMTPQTAEPILLSTFRNKVPLVGLSTSWVKAGALYALDRDYVDVGLQCGEVAGRILGGAAAGTIPPATPRRVTYAVNLKTAGAMNIDVPQELIRGASQVFQ